MKETLKKLWNEYFIDECAAIDNEEERVLIRRAGELHDGVNELLTEEQVEIFEKYVEEIYKAQGFFAQKAFLKGCEFAIAFILEALNFEKAYPNS